MHSLMLILNAEMEKALRSQERNKGEMEKHRASELASPTANSSSGHESVSKVTGWSTASALFLQKECLTLNRRYPGTRERAGRNEVRKKAGSPLWAGTQEKAEDPGDSGRSSSTSGLASTDQWKKRWQVTIGEKPKVLLLNSKYNVRCK